MAERRMDIWGTVEIQISDAPGSQGVHRGIL